MLEINSLSWRIASTCHGGSCLEVARIERSVFVRISGDPEGPVLACSTVEWRAFVDAAKRGEFDV
jgi:hypothetical protein